MSISMAICEKDAPDSFCALLKKTFLKALVPDPESYGNAADKDVVVSLDDAKSIFPNFDEFLARNRINPETDAIYMDKVKKDDDRLLLEPKSHVVYTGWVRLDSLSSDLAKKALDSSLPENRVSGWDMLDFDEMNDKCKSCPLSWDKGRGCMGSFGPDNSKLPEIASKYGCDIIASIPEAMQTGKIFTSEEATLLLKETEKLTAILPDEGKLMVRRYSGPVERLAAMAEVSIKQGCGFYFL